MAVRTAAAKNWAVRGRCRTECSPVGFFSIGIARRRGEMAGWHSSRTARGSLCGAAEAGLARRDVATGGGAGAGGIATGGGAAGIATAAGG